MSTTYQTIHTLLETLPVVSSHEHHWPDELQFGLTLDRIVEKSYVGWRGVTPGPTPEERAAFLNRQRGGSYFAWLEKGIQRVHGFDQKLTAENWDELSECIARRHQAPGEHIAILRDAGRYRRAVQDTYWQYGSDIGHPEMFSADDADGHVRARLPPCGSRSRRQQPVLLLPRRAARRLRGVPRLPEALFTGWRRSGAVAMKSASAYERPLGYGAGDMGRAAAVFGRPPETVSAG